jgi:hypothetical protein
LHFAQQNIRQSQSSRTITLDIPADVCYRLPSMEIAATILTPLSRYGRSAKKSHFARNAQPA